MLTDGNYTYPGEHYKKIIKFLYCAPETNLTMPANYTGIKIKIGEGEYQGWPGSLGQ